MRVRLYCRATTGLLAAAMVLGAGCSEDDFPFSATGSLQLTGNVCGVTARPNDGALFAFTGGQLVQLDLAGAQIVRVYPITMGSCRGHFTADGQQLALASNSSVLLGDVEKERFDPKPVVSGNSIRDAAPVGDRLLWTVSSSFQGGLHHGPEDGSSVAVISPPVGPGQQARGEHLMTTSDDGTAYFTNPSAGRFHRVEVSGASVKLTASYSVGQHFNQVVIARDGRWGLAVGVQQQGVPTQQLALVDIKGAKAMQWRIGESEGWTPFLAAINPADSDEAVVLYRGQGGNVLTRFRLSQRAAEGQLPIAAKGSPVALAYSSDGGRLAVFGSGGDVTVLERD